MYIFMHECMLACGCLSVWLFLWCQTPARPTDRPTDRPTNQPELFGSSTRRSFSSLLQKSVVLVSKAFFPHTSLVTLSKQYPSNMSDDEADYNIDSADAGASDTIPMEAGQIKKGGEYWNPLSAHFRTHPTTGYVIA